MIHGPAFGNAHLSALGRIEVIQSGQVEVSMNEVEGQFLGEGQASGAFELAGLHGRHTDLAGDAGLWGSLKGDYIGQAVVL